MSLDPKWLAGFFDACGRLTTYNENRPRPMIVFETGSCGVMWYFTEQLPLGHSHYSHNYGFKGTQYTVEITDEESLRKIFTVVKEHSPINRNRADVGFYLLGLISKYPTDPVAIMTGRAIAQKLTWEAYNEPELPTRSGDPGQVHKTPDSSNS